MPKKISKAKKAQFQEAQAAYEPVAVALGSEDYALTRRRRNVAAITEREYRYKNIEDGLTPFRYDKHNYGNGIETCSIYEAVILCQKAYYNYGPLRNVIDLMVDFSATDLYLKGSTAKIRKFYQAWFNKVGINNLVTQFFREYYRSGNVFLYKHAAKLKESDLRNLVKLYGGQTSTASAIIPVRYVILNPADIQSTGTMSMGIAKTYYKRLSDYELERLKNPRTPEDKEVFDSLDEDVKKQIKSGVAQALIPLPMKDITYIGYCRLSYEPFAVPFAYPVLEDINYKLELKKIDMALSRSVQQSMLLITLGDENGVNQNNILAIQKLLENGTVSRSIVADYTTKAQFINPDISELLSPEKYTIVDRDINLSLNNILVGEEKFANSKNKIDVFIARLEQGRKVFIEEFLKIEMAKVAEELGFESCPVAYFDAITLTDDINKMRVYSRLLELGILTPDQAMKAIDTGRLPNKEEMEEAQKEYIKQREQDFYQPLIGGGQKESETGRPAGTQGIPQTTKKVGKIGTGEKFDTEKIAKNIIIAGKLDNIIKKKLKSKFKLKELTLEQEALVPELKSLVIANHGPSEWLEKAEVYCDRPLDTNPERVSRVQDIALNHQVETWMAGILFASIKYES